MRHWLDRAGVATAATPDDTVGVVPLFDESRGCDLFTQRVLTFQPGRSRERLDGASDEVLYVLEGTGDLLAGGVRLTLRPGLGLGLRAGTPWSVEAHEALELVSVLVHDPVPGPGPNYAAVDLGEEDRQSATASRQFALGVRAEAGCPSVTQFVGFVPPGRAPDHFHLYDEVIYVLEGEGVLHIDGEQSPLMPGACVHLPSRLVHCLENSGPEELHLLGVFRPSGSPAEAYYPDGTPAVYPGEDCH